MNSNGIEFSQLEHFKKTPKERKNYEQKVIMRDILITMKDEGITLDDLVL